VYAYCVDNALVKPGDPTFVGFCALRNVAAGAKVIAKAAADEPVGVFTRRDGKGAFYTLVPIRPRSRGERRSLRTLPGASLRPSLAFNLRPRRL